MPILHLKNLLKLIEEKYRSLDGVHVCAGLGRLQMCTMITRYMYEVKLYQGGLNTNISMQYLRYADNATPYCLKGTVC